MIHVRLAGGLGNQLFQLAAALYLRHPASGVQLHTAALDRYVVTRKPDLLRAVDCEGHGISVCSAGGIGSELIVRYRAGRWLPRWGMGDRKFAAHRAGRCRIGILDGYFQDAWTDGSILAARQLYLPRLLLRPLPDVECLPFAMHIRGGDLARDPRLGIIDSDWYAAQLSALRRRAHLPHVHVITDDVPFAAVTLDTLRSRLPEVTFEILQSTGAIGDFNALRCARQRLVGNSTFALWATILDVHCAPTRAPAFLGVRRRRRWQLPWEELD